MEIHISGEGGIPGKESRSIVYKEILTYNPGESAEEIQLLGGD